MSDPWNLDGLIPSERPDDPVWSDPLPDSDRAEFEEISSWVVAAERQQQISRAADPWSLPVDDDEQVVGEAKAWLSGRPESRADVDFRQMIRARRDFELAVGPSPERLNGEELRSLWQLAHDR